jgi:phage-related baseplate assembly protein
MTISVLTLFTAESAERILAKGLQVATSIGLPVTSWRTGDPTRSLYKYLAVKLAETDVTVANLARSAILSVLVAAAQAGDEAARAWLKVVALEVYGVTVQEATFAAGTITVTNTGGGYYPVEPGDITFKASAIGKTYHNTSKPRDEDGIEVEAISAGGTYTLDFVADEDGSDSTVAADEIDEMVTTLLGVVIDSNTSAVGLDEEEPESVGDRCRDSLGALSPDGPADAYRYVAKNSALTGVTAVTRAISVDNEDGTVTVYIAGPSGAVAGGVVTAVQTAIDKWATPNCVTATVFSAATSTINVDATVAYGGALSDPDLSLAITAALSKALSSIDIGGDDLTTGDKGVSLDAITSAIRSIAGVTSVAMVDPSGNTVLTPNQVPVLGTVAITVA